MRGQRARNLTMALLALAAVGCSGLGDSVTSHNNQSASAPFTFVVPAADRTQLRLEGVTGTITIGGDANAQELRIGGTRRVASASIRDAQDRLPGLQVTVAEGATEVLVRTSQPKNTEGRDYTVDYTITLPSRLAVEVASVTGSVGVRSINNSVAVDLVTGDVHLDRIVGAASVGLVTGAIEGRITLPEQGTIRLTTVTGNIVLRVPAATSAMLAAQVVTGITAITNLELREQQRSPTSIQGRLGDGRGTIALSAVTGAITITGF